jgi:hypothetical protein
MPARKKAAPEPEPVDTGPDEEVEVEFGENPAETATLLLAAAEEAGLDQSVVRTGTGVFYVPKSIADKAKK